MRRIILAFLALAGACRPVGADASSLARWQAADAETQAFALRLARRAFDEYCLRRRVIEPPRKLPTLLRERAGVFVSAMRAGAPRCCMGSLYPLEPNLAGEIVSNAVAAAGRDRRFAPIRPGELKQLLLIVSVVGTPRPITAAEAAALDPVRDGLVAKAGDRCGVVLSGETPRVERMLRWARIRAGARERTPVQYFRLDVVRFMEER